MLLVSVPASRLTLNALDSYPGNEEHTEGSPLTLHVVSYKSGKPAVAATATTLLRDHIHSKTSDRSTCKLIGPSIQDLNAILEG